MNTSIRPASLHAQDRADAFLAQFEPHPKPWLSHVALGVLAERSGCRTTTLSATCHDSVTAYTHLTRGPLLMPRGVESGSPAGHRGSRAQHSSRPGEEQQLHFFVALGCSPAPQEPTCQLGKGAPCSISASPAPNIQCMLIGCVLLHQLTDSAAGGSPEPHHAPLPNFPAGPCSPVCSLMVFLTFLNTSLGLVPCS